MKVQKFYPPNSNSARSMCYELINGKNWAYYWFNKAGITTPFLAAKTASMRLPDGICIGLNPEIQKENDHEYSPAWGANVFVDVNGAKGPNIAGYDLFFFVIVGNAIKPYGYNLSPETVNSTGGNACNLAAGNGGYMCAARIMNEGWEIKYR